ncbi:MAG: SDR family NAD(P)-dependent oxidoreductase [Haliea sp.]|jgi:NAD(P)-dependent dehydrogenase (short-subunit alcohol dehydrogenase family)|nr:SDR family NAD(P)-dependent oxidoreductase [Haliea sp.]
MNLRLLLRKPFVDDPFAKKVDLTGRHVIVTGVGPGSLGYETAKTLAHWGALVIVTTRRNTAAAVEALTSELANEDFAAKIYGHELDLCDADSVNRFTRWYLENYGDRLDVLVNNAGVHLDLMSKWKEPRLTQDGQEVQWRTNFLGTAHLTHNLLPLLQKTGDSHGDARVVNVVSQIHSRARNEALFDSNTSYNSWKFYGLSKLAMIHFSHELNRRFSEHNNVQGYCLHPGGASGTYTEVATRGFENSPIIGFLRKLGAPIERLFMSTAEEGAQTQVHCATSPQARGGHYYLNCAVSQASADTQDTQVALRLWQQTQDWINTLPNATIESTANVVSLNNR